MKTPTYQATNWRAKVNIYTFASNMGKIVVMADTAVDAKYRISMSGVDVAAIKLVDELPARDGAAIKLLKQKRAISTAQQSQAKERTEAMLQREIVDLAHTLADASAALDMISTAKIIANLGRAQRLLDQLADKADDSPLESLPSIDDDDDEVWITP
jgi:hypothetical protein